MKNILIYICGFISASVICVSATLIYNAKEIEFKADDETWEVNNVEDAINDIKNNYDTKIKEFTLIGSTPFVDTTSTITYTFDNDYDRVLVVSNSIDILPETKDYTKYNLFEVTGIDNVISTPGTVIKTYNRNSLHGETRTTVHILYGVKKGATIKLDYYYQGQSYFYNIS